MKPVLLLLLFTTTMLTGCFESDHNYGKEHVKREAIIVSSETTHMFGVETSNIAVQRKMSVEPKTEDPTREPTTFVPLEFKLNADSLLESYIGSNLMRGVEEVPMSNFPEIPNFETLLDVVQKVQYQNPLVLGLKSYGYNYNTRTLLITYQDKPDVIKRKQEEILQEARHIVSSIIQDDMDDEEKRRAIYDWLNDNATYDYSAYLFAKNNQFKSTDESPHDSFTAYGVLVNKMGVCNSYASAFKLLGDLSGIKSIVVTGQYNGIPHAWNKVKIGDQWLNTDATNNATNSGVPYMVYNSNDETAVGFDLIIGKEYWIDSELDQFKGESNVNDYYSTKGLEVSSLEAYKSKVKSALKQGNSTVTLRYTGKMDLKALETETEQIAKDVNKEKKLSLFTLRNYIVINLN